MSPVCWQGFRQRVGASGIPVQRILSKRGSAVADPQTNIIFINDIPSKLEEIRSFINAIDVGARQVLIEARVVEANDSFNRDLGVKLGFINSKPVQLGGTGIYTAGGTVSPAVTSGTTTTPATLNQNAMFGVNLLQGRRVVEPWHFPCSMPRLPES